MTKYRKTATESAGISDNGIASGKNMNKRALRKDFYVADTVYAPKETELLRVARKFGVKKAINGEGMMLYQGAESFKLWTGKEMTVEHIKDILNLEF